MPDSELKGKCSSNEKHLLTRQVLGVEQGDMFALIREWHDMNSATEITQLSQEEDSPKASFLISLLFDGSYVHAHGKHSLSRIMI
jgi:hypothetical protein